VSYRSQHPDEETREKVRKELKENNINASQLVEYKTDHCQHAESSTERRSPPKDTAGVIRKLLSLISNILKN